MEIRETISFPFTQHAAALEEPGWAPSGVKINGLAKFFCASLAAHLALAGGLWNLNLWKKQETPPLTVDFTMESPTPGPAPAPPSPTSRLITRNPAPLPQLPRNAAIKTPDTPAQLQAAAPEKPSAAKLVTTPKPATGAGKLGQSAQKTGPETSTAPPSGEPRNNNTGRNGQTASGGSGETTHSGAEQTAYLREQFTYIRDTVMGRLAYPSYARRMGWSGKVVVSFIVAEDGSVHELKIRKDSGFPILDKGAMEAVARAAPFPRPSARVEVVLPVTYRLL